MSTRIAVLTVSPLSGEFRTTLDDWVEGSPLYVNLAELRRLPLREAMSRLHSLRGMNFLLPLESPDARAIVPILEGVAAFARARSLDLVTPELERIAVPRSRVLRSLGALARASAEGQIARRRNFRELTGLLNTARSSAAPVDGGRVVYLNGNLWLGLKAGGSIGHVAGVVNGLRALGHGVTLASVVDPIGIRGDVEVVSLAPPPVFGLPIEINAYPFQRSMAAAVATLGATARPSFVYQRLSIANYVGVLASRSWDVPLVLEYNGSEVWVARHWGQALRYEEDARAAEAAALRHAHVVVTVSEALRDDLVERGVEAGRIAWYPNGVDPDLFAPAGFDERQRALLRARYGIPPDALVVGFIGTFGQWHGVEVLARVVAEFARRSRDWLIERKLHFLLVGDGLRMPEVGRELEGAADPFVTLTGLVPQSEGALHLSAADILVSPHVPNADGSRFFGSPTKLFEYMAMEKPIVASDLDQIGNVLRPALETKDLPRTQPAPGDERLAVLAAPGDEAALARGIRFLAEEPVWRTVLGRNARGRVLNRHTWRHHVAAILDRIEHLPPEAVR
jgi:glycosyltransferase involved in cell wall biosynthesis